MVLLTNSFTLSLAQKPIGPVNLIEPRGRDEPTLTELWVYAQYVPEEVQHTY